MKLSIAKEIFMKTILFTLILTSLSTVMADTTYKDNIDPNDLSFKQEGTWAPKTDSLKIYVKGQEVSNDKIPNEYSKDKPNKTTASKIAYFEEVKKIASSEKFKSKLKIVKGSYGYKWVEAVSEPARSEVYRMMSWDGKPRSVIASVKSAWVTIDEDELCSTSPVGVYLVKLFVIGKLYNSMIFDSQSDCKKHANYLKTQLASSEMISLFPEASGRKGTFTGRSFGYTQIIPVLQSEKKAESETAIFDGKKDAKIVEDNGSTATTVAPTSGLEK